MSWIFWVLLAVTLAIMITPFTGVLTPDAAFTFWVVGSVLLVAAIIWIVATLSRAAAPPTTAANASA